jgi:hypothetical protein
MDWSEKHLMTGRVTAESEAKPAPRFFFQTPNIIFELGLSSRELALYLVIRRTAGDDGSCWRSTRTLARMAGMSTGSVSNAKRQLSRPFLVLHGKALIQIRKIANSRGGKARDEITIVNIWSENEKHYTNAACATAEDDSSAAEQSGSPDELRSSAADIASSAGETKKTNKRILIEERPPSLSPSSREKLSEISLNQISELWKFVCTIFGRDSSRDPDRKELRLMRALIPIQPDECDLVKWWFGLRARDYHYTHPIRFMIDRRPMSVRRLLEDWPNVIDVARRFRNEQRRIGRI